MLKIEMLCGLASLREKFMGQLRLADVSRKGAKARRRFPGLASWRWIHHVYCPDSGSTQSGFPLFCFPVFVFSGRWPVMREPFIRAILSYFELFRVNLSSALHHSITPVLPAPATNHPNQSESK